MSTYRRRSSRGASAWNDRLQKHLHIRFDKRYQEGITANADNKYALIRVFILVRVFDNVEDRSLGHGNQHLLKGYPPFRFQDIAISFL
jgi:hypothetical protein